MSILGFLGDAIKPAFNLIDDLHTSAEEKLELRIRLADIQNALALKVLEYERVVMESKAKIITAEAQGGSWIQRNWRPVTMLTFLALVVCDSFGLLMFRLSQDAWTLLKIGLGGYVCGRSGEKIVKHLKEK